MALALRDVGHLHPTIMTARSLVVCSGNFPVRSETFVTQHVLGLAARGHTLTTVCGGHDCCMDARMFAELDEAGVRRIEVGSVGRNRSERARSAFQFLRHRPSLVRDWFPAYPWNRNEMFQARLRQEAIARIDPDLVHVHFGAIAGPLHRTNPDRRMIVTWHGYDANRVPKAHGEETYTELFAGRHHHTVGSHFMWRRLLELGAREDAMSLIPMGIDLDHFRLPAIPRSRGRTLNILSVGRLHEMKGHLHLIDAVARLRDEGKDVELRIIGEGPLREPLRVHVEKLGLGGIVSFLGAQPSDRVLKELHAADLFALTSVVAGDGTVETQGVVIAEAQATGLPVVASDVGGIPDSLIDGETGTLCPPGDVRAIASAIGSFVEHPKKGERFGARARAFVEERFGLKRMLDSFEALYERQLAASS